MQRPVGQVVLRGVLRRPQQKIDYVTLGEGMKEALFTDAVPSFVSPKISRSCVRDLEDNEVPMALAVNSLSSARSK